MGKQIRGGPLIDTSKKGAESCLRCKVPVNTDELLCSECGKSSGLSYIITGDLPFIMTFISVIICFLVSQMEIGGPFHVPGIDLSLRTWSMLLLSISGLFNTLFIPFIWRSFLSKDLYFTLLRTMAPVLTISGPIVLIIFGPSPVSILYFSISLVLGISLIIITKGSLRKVDPSDLILLLVSFALILSGFLLSQRGIGEFMGISFIPNSFITFVGALLFPVAIFRVDRNVTIQIRSSLVFPSIFIVLLLAAISAAVHINVGSGEVSGICWMVTLILLMIAISHGILKRKMDADLLYSFKNGQYNNKLASEYEKEGDTNYLLHSLDIAISSNPFHGLGDIPENGNLIFKVHGRDGWSSIVKEPDEYVTAHSEKARLLASRGRFIDAIKEYRSALTKGPDHLKTYYHLSMLQASIPGRSEESRKNLDIFLTSRKQFLARLINDPLLDHYKFVFNELFKEYTKTLERKRFILSNLGKSGDIWSYFTLMRES